MIGQKLLGVEKLHDVHLGLADLNDLWNQLQIQVEDRQLRFEQTMAFQQKYHDTLQGMSSWLDTVEYKLFSPESDKDADIKIKESEVGIIILHLKVKISLNIMNILGGTIRSFSFCKCVFSGKYTTQ